VIAIVADGGPSAGLGHLGRCSAIAAALRARGLQVECRAYGGAAPLTIDGIDWTPGVAGGDVVVLDTYTMPEHERRALVSDAPLVAMHDHGGAPPGAALVVTVGGDPAPGVLAGLRYAPLRAPFWGLPERTVSGSLRRVLVTTGGGALQDAGVALAREATGSFPEVALVRGPYATFEAPPGVELIDAPPTLLPHLLAADAVITAAGQTALEAAATGAATIAVPFVGNQRRNAAALERAGAAVVAEPGDAVAAAAAVDAASLARAGQVAVDGYGALRIAFAVATLAG
jgi:spore coat polysaccharide biosynthesis predicted glycosyltransferase SpsG